MVHLAYACQPVRIAPGAVCGEFHRHLPRAGPTQDVRHNRLRKRHRQCSEWEPWRGRSRQAQPLKC